MGLGLHGGGLEVAKWLHKQGAKLTITDLRNKKILQPTISRLPRKNIQYVLGKHEPRNFQKADLIIKNPGVPRDSKFLKLARINNIPIETDISLFFSICKSPIIGITGTKGKSTTTSLIYKILTETGKKPVMGGNIRISPLTFVNKIKPATPVILELSSWQLEDMEAKRQSPNIAVVTNVLPDHLNRYKNMADYARSKKLILAFQHPSDLAILNYDNRITRQMGKSVKGTRIWFSKHYIPEENSCFIKKQTIVFRLNGREQKICQTKDLKILGEHNLENVLAAVAVACFLKVPRSSIKKTITKFTGIADRLEFVKRYKQRDFYNDTTATTPEAAQAALNSFFQKNVILLAGGYDKQLSYFNLCQQIKKNVEFLVLFKGSATDKILKELKKMNYQRYYVTDNMKDALKYAWKKSQKNSIILLSPGAASFGIFLNEFDRGDQFKKSVKALI